MGSTYFQFGRPGADANANCCTKPVGCNQTHAECLCLNHPWKRAMVFGDTTVRCQAKTGEPTPRQCMLLNGHDGACLLP